MHGSESRCSLTSTLVQLALWLSLRAMSKALVLKAGAVNLQPCLIGRGIGLLGLVMQLWSQLDSPECMAPHASLLPWLCILP